MNRYGFNKLSISSASMNYMLLIVLILIILEVPAYATDWYARSGCTTNGAGTGSSCGSAWNNLSKILWANIKPGDTLYIIGTFRSNLIIGTGGTSAGGDITIRGNHPTGPGQVGDGTTMCQVCVNNYVTLDNITVYGNIRKCIDKYYTLSTGIQFIASSNEVRDYNKGLISAGFTVNDQFLVNAAVLNNNKVFGIRSIKDEGSYESMIVNTETEGAMWPIYDEGPGAYDLCKFKKLSNVTISNCRVIAIQNSYIDPLDLGGISNLTISHNDVDGGGFNTNGAFYIDTRDSWKRPSNVVIKNNFIHDIGSPCSYSCDAHCIGVQAGNGIIVKNNHLKNCASGIVLYPGATENTSLDGLEIIGNFIKGMNCLLHSSQFPGNGITFSGEDQCPLCEPALIAYNVIAQPINCPTDVTWKCVGIASKWVAKNKIYNNTLVANSINLYLGSTGASADLRNNISAKPKRYHIYLNLSPLAWTEDYNIYYPDSGTRFYAGGIMNYTTYITKHPAKISGIHNLTSDPLFTGVSSFNLQPLSPAINRGDNAVWFGKPNMFDITESLEITDGSGAIIAPGDFVDIGAYER